MMRTAERWVYKIQDGGKIKKRFYRFLLRTIFSFDVPLTIKVGKNVQFPHNGLGVVIHKDSVIGDNCIIYQNVTLGGNGKIVNGEIQRGGPTLSDGVAVFCGACVLGPVVIGKNTYIAANTVITKDIPEDVLAVGNPFKIVKREFEYNFQD